jgi:hypothetical protein
LEGVAKEDVVNYTAIWSVYRNLVYFVAVILYLFPRFGLLYQEKIWQPWPVDKILQRGNLGQQTKVCGKKKTLFILASFSFALCNPNSLLFALCQDCQMVNF